jgi:hypothetical protein
VGAVVQVPGTNQATIITDAKGAFTLSVGADVKTLRISNVGYLALQLSIGAQIVFANSIRAWYRDG